MNRMNDASRRDVLSALAGAIAIPAVGDVADLDASDQQQDLADNLDDRDPFWVVLFWSAQVGDPQEVENRWLPMMALLSPRGMDEDDMWSWIYAAARGECDDGELRRQAAHVWGLHR